MLPSIQQLIQLNKELRRPVPTVLLNKRCQQSEAPVYLPFMYFGAKALSTHAAILTLSAQKAGLEAAMLLRSLFETGITAFWIVRDLENRLPMFNQAIWHVHRKFNRIVQSRRSDIPDGLMKELEASLRLINPEVDKYSKKYGKKKPGSWGSVSFKEMAESLDLGERYDFIYGTLSDLEHTGPGGIIHYIRQFPSGELGIVSTTTTTAWMLTVVLQESYVSLLTALEAVNAALGLQLEEHLDDARSKLSEVSAT